MYVTSGWSKNAGPITGMRESTGNGIEPLVGTKDQSHHDSGAHRGEIAKSETAGRCTKQCPEGTCENGALEPDVDQPGAFDEQLAQSGERQRRRGSHAGRKECRQVSRRHDSALGETTLRSARARAHRPSR